MNCPEKPRKEELQSDSIAKKYEIQVITPIFGGGVEAGVNDPITPIRPSSIRGHLRFWWRATRGKIYKTLPELRQREGEIWGTTENPSPVVIDVDVEAQNDPSECAHYVKRMGRSGYALHWSKPFDTRGSSLPYVLFPFQGTSPDSKEPKDPSKMIGSATFMLAVNFPKKERMDLFKSRYDEVRSRKGLPLLTNDNNNIQKDVESAIWAWLNFGGIGARSRRGCGALYCKKSHPIDPDLTPSSCQDFDKWLKERISHYEIVLSSTSRDWPTMGRFHLSRKEGPDSISCWEDCIDVMKEIRQGMDLGRDPGSGGRPGRSRWPEPESVRNLVLKQKGLIARPHMWHPTDHRMPDIAFPRAEFGMPIIIEIRGEGLKPTLQPSEDHDRMASPLILRPIRFSNGRFAPMIIRLNTLPLDSAYLKPGKNDLKSGYPISASEIADPGRSAFPNSPRHKFCGTGSALDAFMSFAQSRGFMEVFP